MTNSSSQQRRHLLTIGLDDYFHSGALKGVVQQERWYRFETRIEQNTLNTLSLLDQVGAKATFFVMGWIADTQPDLVKEVVNRGHEVANLGYYHRTIHEMTRQEFEDDLSRSEEALIRATGSSVLGYRLARPLFKPSDLWVLDVLAQRGYVYDSSIMPMFRSFKDQPWRRFAHRHQAGTNQIWEFPFSTWNYMGYMVPIAGGNYFRQLPHSWVKSKVEYWDRSYSSPFVLYFHVWDLDPDQPKIHSAPTLAKIRAYRNLGKMRSILEEYLSTYKFGSIAEHLGINPQDGQGIACVENSVPGSSSDRQVHVPDLQSTAAPKKPVTIVVPCFNEKPTLPYLANTLGSVRKSLGQEYQLNFILVDDGSTDETWTVMQRIFGGWTDCTLVRQERNLGVAGAILNGIRHAKTEIVCSIDCDCTYDPHDLRHLIPLLTDEVDLVTGSPYHSRGHVLNVPGWRLLLSKTASHLYRLVLRQNIATYTSSFRVYRKSAVANLKLRETGFLGVAEMLGVLDLRGSKIVECPTTLEVRLLGHSKMKVAITVMGHLRVLGRLMWARLSSPRSRPSNWEKAIVTSTSKAPDPNL